VQAVVKLALEAPLELGIVQVPWVQLEVISMYGNGRILKLDNDFHPFSLGPRREIKQWVLIETELGEHAFQARIGSSRHKMIVK
jgi:hypothetical protein